MGRLAAQESGRRLEVIPKPGRYIVLNVIPGCLGCRMGRWRGAIRSLTSPRGRQTISGKHGERVGRVVAAADGDMNWTAGLKR